MRKRDLIKRFFSLFHPLRNSKGALTPNLWSEVQCEKVSKLLYDIDGLVKYELGFEKERRMESS